jgi:hypothetical protein
MAAAENYMHYWLTINESHPVSAIGNLLCINSVETSGAAIKACIVFMDFGENYSRSFFYTFSMATEQKMKDECTKV